MAINAGMVWEVRSGGDDTNNGGGFRGGSPNAAPPAPTLAKANTGGTILAGTWYFVLTYTDRYGETVMSAEASIVTTGTTSTITVTKPASPPTADPAPAGFWNIYAGSASGGPYWVQTTGQALATNKTYTAPLATSGAQAPGVDRSQQTNAQVNIDNAAITATTTGANSNILTFTGGTVPYTPTAADVGNCFQATGGTNINAGVYEIIAWTATTWTVTGATNLTGAGGAGAAVVGKMGGCFASPGKAFSVAPGSNTVWVASGTYDITGTNNVAGGRVTLPAGTATAPTRLYGYQTTRFDWSSTRPILQSNANSLTILGVGNDGEVDSIETKLAHANTAVVGFLANATRTLFRRCKATNLNNAGFSCTSGFSILISCECSGISGGTAGFSITAGGTLINCVAQNCTQQGFATTTCTLIGCIVANQTGSGQAAFASTTSGWLIGCVAYSIANGFGFKVGGETICINCISEGSAGASGSFGFSGAATLRERLINCAGFNNGVDVDYATLPGVENFHALSGSPFTSAVGNDFSLNNTAGAGAVLRAAGFPSSFPGLSTTAYPDIGAVQHADPAITAAGPIIGCGFIKGVAA